MFKYWGIDSEFLEEENIISKLNLLLKIERMDPYNATGTLQDRIQNSLEGLPQQYRKYALAIYANTIYLPNDFSNSILEHLFNALTFEFQIKQKVLENKCLILEQDPTGIVNAFLRRNHIEGRLDKNKFQRTQQIKPFVTTAVINQKYPCLSEKAECEEPLERLRIEDVMPFLEREYWIVLVDNALSGTSLFSDLYLLIKLSEQQQKKPKKIILLIRTLTKQALDVIRCRFWREFKEGYLEYRYGLFLDERFVVRSKNEKECMLFKNPKTYEGVIELCQWFAEQRFFKENPRIADHAKNSADNSSVEGFDSDGKLTYGFKGCGLTYVTSENCPSDSLPLLWFNSPGHHIPPFPRVLSRLGDQDRENLATLSSIKTN